MCYFASITTAYPLDSIIEPIMKRVFTFTLILAFTIVSSSRVYGSECFQSFSKKIEHAYHKALFDGTIDPYDLLRSQSTDPEITTKLSEFENDIIDLIKVVPEERNLTEFVSKWKISKQVAEDVLMFWGIAFYGSIEIAGGSKYISSRLTEIKRVESLSEVSIPLFMRYRFYVANLRVLSVPEMSKLLKVSQGTVYQELGLLSLSLVEAWNQPLSYHARKNLENEGYYHSIDLEAKTNYLEMGHRLMTEDGLTVSEAAEVMGVGSQALEFARHARLFINTVVGAQPRGESWDRVGNFKEKPQMEVQILLSLYQDGYTRQAIAQKLNVIFNTDTNSKSFRTTASVTEKLRSLGIQEISHTQKQDITHKDFGDLKKNGKLVIHNAIVYIQSKLGEMTIAEIAKKLDMSDSGLKSFMQRHFIASVIQRSSKESTSEATAIIKNYAKQRQASILNVINMMRKAGNKIPTVVKTKKSQRIEEYVLASKAYNWIYLNRNSPDLLALLPPDLREVIENHTWKIATKPMDVLGFEKVVINLRYTMPKRALKPDNRDFTEEEKLINQAARWIYDKRNDEDILNSFSPKVRTVIDQNPFYDASKNMTGKKASAVMSRLKDKMPKYYRKNDTKNNPLLAEESNAYDHIRRYHNDDGYLDDFTLLQREVIRDYFTTPTSKEAAIFVTKVMRRLGDKIPNPNRNASDDLKKEEHRAYNWIIKNRHKPEKMSLIPLDLREIIANYEWRTTEKVIDDKYVIEVMSELDGSIPPSHHGRKKGLSEQELREKSAFNWLKRNNENTKILENFPLDYKENIKSYDWKSDKKIKTTPVTPPTHEKVSLKPDKKVSLKPDEKVSLKPDEKIKKIISDVVSVMRKNGNKVPPSTSKKAGSISLKDHKLNRKVYEWIRNNENDPEMMKLLPEDLQTVIKNKKWRETNPINAQRVIAVMRKIGNKFPDTHYNAKETTPDISEERKANAWLKKFRNDETAMNDFPDDLKEIALKKQFRETATETSPEMIDRVVRFLGMKVPTSVYAKKDAKTLNTEEREHKKAYKWITKHKKNSEKMSKLDIDVRKVIENHYGL